MPTIARRAILAGIFAGTVASAALPARAEGALWPNVDLIDANGATFQLGSMDARLTVVHIWAHWCAPCLAELPALAAVAQRIGPRASVLLVSHPQNWAADVAYAQRRGLPFRVATLAPGAEPWVRPAVFEEHNGRYTVPRTLLFRATDQAMLPGDLRWDSPAAMERLTRLMG